MPWLSAVNPRFLTRERVGLGWARHRGVKTKLACCLSLMNRSILVDLFVLGKVQRARTSDSFWGGRGPEREIQLDMSAGQGGVLDIFGCTYLSITATVYGYCITKVGNYVGKVGAQNAE